MRIVSWNVHSKPESSPTWDFLLELDADIALLQEVGSIPPAVLRAYNGNIVSQRATNRYGKPQRFFTTVLSKLPILGEIELTSGNWWVQEQADFFSGTIVGCRVAKSACAVNVVSVHCPSWAIPKSRWSGPEVHKIKLDANPDVWFTEILWDQLCHTMPGSSDPWIVGGDFNSSESFDLPRDRGNREIARRYRSLGLTEVLRRHNGNRLVPTYKSRNGGPATHQIDHLWVSNGFADGLRQCSVVPEDKIFGSKLSDHLPIVADFVAGPLLNA